MRCSLATQLLVVLLLPAAVIGQQENRSGRATAEHEVAANRPNVLFIAVDDLNTWLGCLGGHPQAKTPHIDRLAGQGVLFERAYCSAPLCNPSRTSLMMGLHPSTTGIYGNLNWFRDHPDFKDRVTIPQYFRQSGYTTYGGGKIFHLPGGKWSDPASWDHQYSLQHGTPAPPAEQRYQHGLKEKFAYNPIVARLNDWGPITQTDEETNDWKTAMGAAEVLSFGSMISWIHELFRANGPAICLAQPNGLGIAKHENVEGQRPGSHPRPLAWAR